MKDQSLEDGSLFVEDPLDLNLLNSDEAVAAFESVSIIYHGLLTTPYHAYSDPRVKNSLNTRIAELSSFTNISCESITTSLETVMAGTYSEESAFFDGVRAVIEKIIEWLGRVKDFVISLIRKMLDIRKRNQQQSKKTEATFRQAKTDYEKAKRDFPTVLTCSVPGSCYLAFHSSKHKPKPGFVYNTQGLLRAIDAVDADVQVFLTRLTAEVDVVLESVELMINQLTVDKMSRSEDALKRINTSRSLTGLYHNNFEFIGVGLIQKPVRNPTRYIQNKLGLTSVVDHYGWNQVENFTVSIETAEFERINKIVNDKTDDALAKIIVLNERLSNSRALKKLSELRKDRRILVNVAQNQPGEDSSITLNAHKQILSRLDLIQEMVGQLTDSCTLTSRFYSRYVIMISRMLSEVARNISENQS